MLSVKWLSVLAAVAVLSSSPGLLSASSQPVEPSTTWLIAGPSDLRLPPPPGAADTLAELAEVQTIAGSRDGASLDRIEYWDAGAPPYRWTQRAVKHAQSKGVAGNRAFRLMALMNVAISDATVAAFDTKFTYNRSRPDAALAAIRTPSSPSYPDEHAVAAGAASTVLASIFPADADLFASWAREAAHSRVEAGVAYPSDVEAGLALGRQVGEQAVAWGQTDGSSAAWTGSVPTEPGTWKGTNPVEPLAGTWRTWALTSPDQFRPGPPPALDSELFARELADVKSYRRTNLTNLTASYWEYYGGRAAFEFWNEHASRLIFEHRWQDDAVQAAHVYALVNIASHDAAVACWDAKYTYWTPRPAMVDSSISTLFVTPNHPSYPSAHSCIASGIGTVLAGFFPSESGSLQALVDQIGEARVMGGIHFPNDIAVGESIGQSVGDVIWARAHR